MRKLKKMIRFRVRRIERDSEKIKPEIEAGVVN